MVDSIRNIRVFISSPGDLQKEREIVTEICNQITQDLGQIKGFRVDPVKWETHSISARAERSQAAISAQVGSYDIYLGLMGTYFGTSTGKYESGTEEEFEEAIKENTEKGEPKIQFYFSSAKVDLDNVDLAQYGRVKEFRNKLENYGVYYRKFEDLAQLQVLVRSGLQKSIFELLESVDYRGQVEPITPVTKYTDLKPYNHLKNLEKLLRADPDVSSSFLFKDATILLNSYTGRLNTVGLKTNEFSKLLLDALRELDGLNKNPNRSQKKAVRLTTRAFEKFEEFVYWLAHEIPKMDSEFMKSMSDMQRASMLMANEIPGSQDDLVSLFDSMELTKQQNMSLSDACEGSIAEIQNVQETGFDGLSTKAYVALIADFVEFLKRANDTMDTARETVLGGG